MTSQSPLVRAIAELVTERENLAARLAKVDRLIADMRDIFHLPGERSAAKPRASAPEVAGTNGHGSGKGAATKAAIRAALKGGPLAPAELSKRLDQPEARLNYHLRQLEQAGVVVRTGVRTSRRIALAGTPAKEAPQR